MNIIGTTPTSLTNSVWGATTKKLTSLIGPIAITIVQNQSLAASTALNVVPAASTIAIMTAGTISGAAGTSQIGFYDGIQPFIIDTNAAGLSSAAGALVITNTSYGLIKNNDAANVAKYAYNLITFA